MKITFLGAAREVTGSMTLIEVGREKLLVDCGMEQGRDVFDRRHYHETNSLGYLTNETYVENVTAILNELK